MELTNDSKTLYAMLIGSDDNYDDNQENHNLIKSPNASENDSFMYNFSMQCLDSYYNMSYLNVSCESNLKFSVIFYGYFFPILLLITVVANSLIVVVLSRRNMASPTNSVLMGKWMILLKFILSGDGIALPGIFWS